MKENEIRTRANSHHITLTSNLTNTAAALKQQSGYALIVVITIMMILGAMATGGVTLSAKTERLAGNAIQRSRSFQAADGAATIAEAEILDMMSNSVIPDDFGLSGLFSHDKRDDQWWRSDNPDGVHVVDSGSILGVVAPPSFAIEQVGNYVADGGTGIVNLDIGSSAYGRLTSGGREFLLFSIESHGNGSFDTVETVVESTVVYSY